MAEFSELLTKLERLTGPDREFDALIHACINDGYVEPTRRPSNRAVIWHRDRGTEPALLTGFPNQTRELLCYADACPAYTASLDAALTLVPEGCSAATSPAFIHSGVGYVANIHRVDKHIIHQPHGHGRHSHLAIALCIASLKARSL